jgi:hypothetical protein
MTNTIEPAAAFEAPRTPGPYLQSNASPSASNRAR